MEFWILPWWWLTPTALRWGRKRLSLNEVRGVVLEPGSMPSPILSLPSALLEGGALKRLRDAGAGAPVPEEAETTARIIDGRE